MRTTTRLHRWPRSSTCCATAVMRVERFVDRFFIGEVDLRTHRPRDPAKRRWIGLIDLALVKSLGEKVRDEPTKRFAFTLPAAFESPQNRRVNIDRRSRHDDLMIEFLASDVKTRGNIRLAADKKHRSGACPIAANFLSILDTK